MNESQGLTTQLARKINSEKGWNLSEQCLSALVKEVSPYVDSKDDSIKIERKLANYFEYSSDINALLDGDSVTVKKYQIYTTKVISKQFQNRPRNYDVEDLVSECWLYIIEKKVLQKYKYASRVTVFLYRIIVNKVLEIMRRFKSVEDKRTTISHSEPIQASGDSEGPSLIELLPTKDLDPESLSEYREIFDVIDELLEKEMKHYEKKTKGPLKETARLLIRVFVLQEIESEYAKKLGDTVENLYLRRFRFKERLKRLLDE